MAQTKIIIALVALTALALVAVGIASAQIATQTPNPTTGTTPNSFWGYMGRCFQFWANPPVDQTTGAPIAPAAPTQVNNAPLPYAGTPNGYGFRSGCMTRFW